MSREFCQRCRDSSSGPYCWQHAIERDNEERRPFVLRPIVAAERQAAAAERLAAVEEGRLRLEQDIFLARLKREAQEAAERDQLARTRRVPVYEDGRMVWRDILFLTVEGAKAGCDMTFSWRAEGTPPPDWTDPRKKKGKRR